MRGRFGLRMKTVPDGMNEPISPYVLTNENSPAFWLIDNLWMPLAGSFLTNGNFCLIEQVCGTGIGGPPTHSHPSDEGLYILEGHCTFHAGGETVQAAQALSFQFRGSWGTVSPWTRQTHVC